MDQEYSVGRWLSILHRYSRMHFAHRLSLQGIAGAQIPFLKSLYREDGQSQDELTLFLRVDPATTTRALAKLEKQGYIVRRPDPKDARVKRVFLTEAARQIEPELSARLHEWSEKLTEGFSDEERDLIASFLSRMAQNAEQAMNDDD